ncbi:hypothetical protein MMC26_001558 [Xylographa opegraphella]|nr:hypothetical protein [Xylographa opegraphella]
MGELSRSTRPVLFFDIDNCLYPRSKMVHDMMQELIDKYFVEHLSLTEADAKMLHQKYYTEYGLAIEGLVRHHKVDPLEYNRKVDDALPLDGVITPDPQLRQLLVDIDRSKVRPWLFTNAFVTHGKRIVKLLGVDDLFEGITYCDYAQATLVCKPHPEMYALAELQSGVSSAEDCFFVGQSYYHDFGKWLIIVADDSYINCHHAQARGWTAAHLVEPGILDPATKASRYQIQSLEELRVIWPQFFRDSTSSRVNQSSL